MIHKNQKLKLKTKTWKILKNIVKEKTETETIKQVFPLPQTYLTHCPQCVTQYAQGKEIYLLNRPPPHHHSGMGCAEVACRMAED